MKTLIASALIVFMLGTSSASQAADTQETTGPKMTYQSVVYPVINSTTIRVNVSKAKDARIQVRLKNAAGETLVSEQLGKGHESSAIKFDLHQLQDGIYQVEVSDGSSKQVKEVTLKTNMPTVETERHIAMN